MVYDVVAMVKVGGDVFKVRSLITSRTGASFTNKHHICVAISFGSVDSEKNRLLAELFLVSLMQSDFESNSVFLYDFFLC